MTYQYPLVNVVMITYGHEDYIKEAIEGVLMQECDFEVELIIANDCSPDDTDSVVQEIIENHTKAHWIKYTRHVTNKGMMNNTIWSLEQCKGIYIALCEGDDYWTDPFKLQKQVDFLEENKNASMCFTYQLIVDINGGKIGESKYKSKIVQTKDVIKGFIPPTQTLLLRNFPGLSNYLDNFKESLSGDRMITYYCSMFGGIHLLPYFSSAYRQTGSGVWNSLDPNEKFFTALEGYIDFHLKIGLPANNEYIQKRINGSFFYLYGKKKNLRDYFRQIKKILKIKKKYGINSHTLNYFFRKIFKIS